MNVPGLPSSFALKVPGLPSSFERKVRGLLFSFELEALNLPFIPGRQALEAIGPALLAYPSQRPQHDGADDHPLMEAGASQHMTHHAQPDQPQCRLDGEAQVPRLCRRPAAARRHVGQ
jgi:hypothetical protein